MYAVLKVVGAVLTVTGFFIIVGTAGSDCDGKCMENAMGLLDTFYYMLMGLATAGIGIYLYTRG